MSAKINLAISFLSQSPLEASESQQGCLPFPPPSSVDKKRGKKTARSVSIWKVIGTPFPSIFRSLIRRESVGRKISRLCVVGPAKEEVVKGSLLGSLTHWPGLRWHPPPFFYPLFLRGRDRNAKDVAVSLSKMGRRWRQRSKR